MKTKYDIVDRF